MDGGEKDWFGLKQIKRYENKCSIFDWILEQDIRGDFEYGLRYK